MKKYGCLNLNRRKASPFKAFQHLNRFLTSFLSWIDPFLKKMT